LHVVPRARAATLPPTRLERSRTLTLPALELAPATDQTIEIEPALDLDALRFAEPAELSPDDSAVVVLSLDQLQPTSESDAEIADQLREIERELALAEDPAAVAMLRVDAGRLEETQGDLEAARRHYEAALL